MVFTTQIFLFTFFPICLFTYIAVNFLEKYKKIGLILNKIRAKDILLIIFSFAFYMWTCFDDIFKLFFYILLVYIVTHLIEICRKNRLFIPIYKDDINNSNSILYKRIFLSIFPFIIVIASLVLYLIYYKYSDFLIRILHIQKDTTQTSLLAPLGLSFLTFSAISYCADVYRGKATAGSFIDCALYLSFFPKIVSGPIVLWQDFQPQIKNRYISLSLGVSGINRIMIGFAKKVLLADTFGACLSKIWITDIDQITAVGSLILYMLQIYYDFAGYSDIAIGLSKLFGFNVKENFNFPYISKSISEFWRRWHISLGTWFREYIYFPLGGSRVGLLKTLRNLGIVFILTGIWHGAGWNYIIWGFINAFFVILERIIQKEKFYQKIPTFIKYSCTMLIVMLFWLLFRFKYMNESITFLRILIGNIKYETIPYTWKYYFDTRIIVFIVIGIICATLLSNSKIQDFYKKITSTKTGYAVQEIILLILFALSILFMVNSTYSPFIYFQY